MRSPSDVFHHVPVMLAETMDFLKAEPDKVYLDCTIGGGGHAAAILRQGGIVIGMDQDRLALEAAGERLRDFGARLVLVHGNFAGMRHHVLRLGFQHIEGIIMDLGVSSPQLDRDERGFSYRHDAPLDMRMDSENKVTAAILVNTLPEAELANLIWRFGEERWAKRIAKFIAEARKVNEITTSSQLVGLIKAAIPASARQGGHHPAKRTFQALRMAVNNELGNLEQALDQVPELLAACGRICVITFHSLEDRIVKQRMQAWARDCHCPPDLPVCTCGGRAWFKVLTRKPVLPGAPEVAKNPRCRSAKLRAAQKLDG